MTGYDAVVAGAGPAGALAALELARNGFRVAVVDSSETASHKIGESLPGMV